MFLRSVIVVVVLCSLKVYAVTYEGEICVKDDKGGVCTNIMKCKSALDDIRNRKNPQICSFDGTNPIVCCLDNVGTTTAAPVATTTKRIPSTTQYVPTLPDYGEEKQECRPIPPTLTSAKTGQKAWDKCLEYQENLVYPCEKGVALSGALSRGNHCHHNADELIVGGTNAALNEFPHMALLGFGEEANIKWLCGGALISDRFVLTAGHCTSSRDEGPVTFVHIGALRRQEVTDLTKRFQVKNIIKNPEFKPPIKYNDIALLELNGVVKLNQFTVPACLHIGDEVNNTRASATGWGLTEYKGSTSDILQKVVLTKFPRDECALKYPSNRLMRGSIDDATQVCYGDRTMSKDTCQGDSGGPLQLKSKKINCMYLLYGVTSFGSACGFAGTPGVYTRVAPYVPWIESIVWP